MTTEQLPSDPETQSAVLSAMIGNHETVRAYSGLLSAVDFYNSRDRAVFDVLTELDAEGKPVDLPALVAELRSRGLLEKAGGASGVAALVDHPPAIEPTYYANKLKEQTLRRRMFQVGNAFQKACFDSGCSAPAALARIQGLVQGINEEATIKTYAGLSDLLLEAADHWEALQKTPGRVSGVSSGFYDLDRLTGGFQSSDLIVLAARTRMGKTALACNIATNAAKAGNRIGIFSLEMSKMQLVARMVSAESNLNLVKFRSALWDATGWERVVTASESLSGLQVFIDDTGGLSIHEIRRRARLMRSRDKVDMVIVDYLGLVVGDSKQGRVEEVSSVSRGLKAMAKELDVPVLALAQLNRACDARDNKRPTLTDLRDSGAIEQDADIVCFIYRDDIYNPNSIEKGIAEVHLAKHRQGPTGVVKLRFHDRTTCFRNLEPGPV